MADFFKFLVEGYSPDIVKSKMITFNKADAATIGLTSSNIKSLILRYRKPFKIGKTGNPEKRVDFTDYRKEGFYEMYLIVKSRDENLISNLEQFYIINSKTTYPTLCKNVQMHSGGKMFSIDGYYYLYIVI